MKKRERNEILATFLENRGISVFLPQSDADQSKSGKEVLDQELEAIRNCESLIIMLSDTRGIYLEAGYAKAIGKKVIALKVEETRELGDWGYAFFDYIVSSKEELAEIIKK